MWWFVGHFVSVGLKLNRGWLHCGCVFNRILSNLSPLYQFDLWIELVRIGFLYRLVTIMKLDFLIIIYLIIIYSNLIIKLYWLVINLIIIYFNLIIQMYWLVIIYFVIIYLNLIIKLYLLIIIYFIIYLNLIIKF